MSHDVAHYIDEQLEALRIKDTSSGLVKNSGALLTTADVRASDLQSLIARYDEISPPPVLFDVTTAEVKVADK